MVSLPRDEAWGLLAGGGLHWRSEGLVRSEGWKWMKMDEPKWSEGDTRMKAQVPPKQHTFPASVQKGRGPLGAFVVESFCGQWR